MSRVTLGPWTFDMDSNTEWSCNYFHHQVHVLKHAKQVEPHLLFSTESSATSRARLMSFFCNDAGIRTQGKHKLFLAGWDSDIGPHCINVHNFQTLYDNHNCFIQFIFMSTFAINHVNNVLPGQQISIFCDQPCFRLLLSLASKGSLNFKKQYSFSFSSP